MALRRAVDQTFDLICSRDGTVSDQFIENFLKNKFFYHHLLNFDASLSFKSKI